MVLGRRIKETLLASRPTQQSPSLPQIMQPQQPEQESHQRGPEQQQQQQQQQPHVLTTLKQEHTTIPTIPTSTWLQTCYLDTAAEIDLTLLLRDRQRRELQQSQRGHSPRANAFAG